MAQGTTKGVPIDVDPTLAADSDLLVPSQKAIKTYVDNVDSSIQTQLSNKQNTITLTTTGSSGAATFDGTTLNIPQYSGGSSGVSVYAKNLTTYSSTGTGSQIIHSLLIPANTFITGDVVQFTARYKKTGNAGTTQTNLALNTSISTSGSRTLKANVFTTTTLAATVRGTAVIINNTTNTQLPWTATNVGPSELVNSTSAWQESIAINWTVDQYLLFVCNPNGAGDVVSLIYYQIQKI
jgi:hypothetical protein